MTQTTLQWLARLGISVLIMLLGACTPPSSTTALTPRTTADAPTQRPSDLALPCPEVAHYPGAGRLRYWADSVNRSTEYATSTSAADVLAYYHTALTGTNWIDESSRPGAPSHAPGDLSRSYVHAIQKVNRPAFVIYLRITDTTPQATRFEVTLQIAGPWSWLTTPICSDLNP